MNDKLFRDFDDLLAEATKLVEEDYDDAQDRATIASFYNGHETMSEDEAKKRGVTELVNHLFGYDSISASKEQITSVITKSPTTFVIDVAGPTEAKRQQWSMIVTRHLNDVINCSKRYRPVHESASGDATLVGSAFYTFLDPGDWCPKSKRPLVPRGTGTLATDVPYAIIPDSISLADLYRFRNISKRQAESGVAQWNLNGINDAIDYLEKNTGSAALGAIQTTSLQTNDEMEFAEQSGVGRSASFRTTIPVYYCITTRSDEEGSPADVTLLCRHTPEYRAKKASGGNSIEPLLWDRKRAFKSPNDWLVPMFLDCSIGGEVSWHRVMGLGRLNYDSDVDVEEFFNDAMQGSKEQVRRLFKVKNGADMDMVERWATGDEFSNLVPDGVDIVEQGKSGNFQASFTTMGMLQQATRRNGNMALSNSGGQDRQVKELEVQALERQGRNAQAISNKIDAVYNTQQAVGERMMKAMLSTSIMRGDKGFPEVAYFRWLLDRDGVPIEYLRQKNKWGFTNWKLKVNKAAGDGDKVREDMTNRMLMQWLSLFSPQAQQVIIRRVVASATNDYQLSEELVPFQQKPDFDQQERAANEGQTMIQRGGTGYVSPIQPDDIAGIHIQEHMLDITSLITKGQAGKWDQFVSAATQALAKHIMGHMQNLAATNPDEAKQVQQQLQQIGQIAQQLDRKLQQDQQQQQIDPTDQANLQLKAQDLQFRQQQQSDLNDHRKAALGLATQKEANRSVENNHRLAIQEGSSYWDQLAAQQEIMTKKSDEILQGQGRGKTVNAYK